MSQQIWDEDEVNALKELVRVASAVTSPGQEIPENLNPQKINLTNAQETKESLVNFVQENELVVSMSSQLIENEINRNLEKQVSKVQMDIKQYILGAGDNNSSISNTSKKQKKDKSRGNVGS